MAWTPKEKTIYWSEEFRTYLRWDPREIRENWWIFRNIHTGKVIPVSKDYAEKDLTEIEVSEAV